MKVTVNITQSFKTAAKPLFKKYRSFSKDLLGLEKELMNNPGLGTSLGYDAYKVRLNCQQREGQKRWRPGNFIS